MLRKKQWHLLLCILISFIVASYGIHRILSAYERPSAVTYIQQSTENNNLTSAQVAIEAQLNNATVQLGSFDEVASATRIDIADFFQPNGTKTTISVIEGTFKSGQIAPPSKWVHLGHALWLLSSVDERQRPSSGSISKLIYAGCGLARSPRDFRSLGLGDIDEHPCKGPYKLYGIADVVNMALVLSKNPHSSHAPCKLGPQYVQCIKDVLATSFRRIFQRADRGPQLDGIIIPPLTTGGHRLPKDIFYESLETAMWQALVVTTESQRAQLPRHIYLQVWSRDRPGEWDRASSGISHTIGDLADNWNDRYQNNDAPKWAPLAGTALGLGLLLAFSLLFARRPEFAAVYSNSPYLIVFACFFALVGFIASLDTLFPSFATESHTWIRFIIGVAFGLLSVPLLRSVRFDGAPEKR